MIAIEAPAKPETIIERQYVTVDFPIITQPEWMVDIAQELQEDRRFRRKLEFSMHQNSIDGPGLFSGARPLSAYYSLKPEKVCNRVVGYSHLLIEKGAINPDGSAKLHDYLNTNIDYRRRCNNGYHLASGHHVDTGGIEIALIDQFDSNNNSFTAAQLVLIQNLIHNGILPITSDGFGVLLN